MCLNKVTVYLEGTEVLIECGSLHGANAKAALCDDCYTAARAQYPQGWKHRPGDTCKHRVYVAGPYDCNCRHCEASI
jgi:hypothetical protein